MIRHGFASVDATVKVENTCSSTSDADGASLDGSTHTGNNGEESKVPNACDGHGTCRVSILDTEAVTTIG